MKQYIIILVFLMFIGLVNSMTCSPTQVNRTILVNETPTSESVTCSNDNNYSVILSKSGSFFSTSLSPLIIPANSSTSFTINFNKLESKGIYEGIIYYSDTTINVKVNVTEFVNNTVITPEPTCGIDVFPTIMTNIKIQQGETKIRNIQLSVPSCFYSSVNVNGVSLLTEEKPIQLGEISIGIIQPGKSISVPVEINAVGISTGQYQDTLQLLLYDYKGTKINVPSVSIGVLVSSGINPLSNFSFTQLPTCSIDSSILNLNNSYKMTCSITNPNIEVKPIIDNKYIQGLSVSESSNQFVYEFKGILTGESSVGAEFIYKNAPIGTPFKQDVKITPSGSSSVGSINLDLQYFQDGVKKDLSSLNIGNTILLPVDSKTGNLISSYDIYLNGLKYNNTISLEIDKIYNLRVTSPGYNDLIISNLSVSQIPIQFTIEPSKSNYDYNDVITINSSIANVSILINDYVAYSPYTITSSGNLTIKLTKDGYISSNKTILVNTPINIVACSPLYQDWKKGKEIMCDLNKNVTWVVLKDGVTVAQGEGTRLSFKITDYGSWQINSGNQNLYSLNLVKKSIFSWDWLTTNWFVPLGALVVGLVIVVIVRNKNNGGNITPYS